MVALLRLLLGSLGRSFQSRSELMLENLALRQQLAMCERPPRAVASDRVFWSAMARLWPRWRSALMVVRPETVMRWHRAGFRSYWRWRSRRGGGGRPPIPLEARRID